MINYSKKNEFKCKIRIDLITIYILSKYNKHLESMTKWNNYFITPSVVIPAKCTLTINLNNAKN